MKFTRLNDLFCILSSYPAMTPFSPDEIHAFLRSRRSVRRFLPEPVPAAVLQRVLETAVYAPSAHNLQPWRLVVLRAAAAKLRLAEALSGTMRADMRAQGADDAEIAARIERSRRRLGEAPAVVVLNLDETVRRDAEDEHERHMMVQSVALLGLQILLAAHAEGLGGVWICWPLYAQEATRQALALPPAWSPQGMLFLGYPAEAPAPPPRKPWQEIIRWLDDEEFQDAP